MECRCANCENQKDQYQNKQAEDMAMHETDSITVILAQMEKTQMTMTLNHNYCYERSIWTTE